MSHSLGVVGGGGLIAKAGLSASLVCQRPIVTDVRLEIILVGSAAVTYAMPPLWSPMANGKAIQIAGLTIRPGLAPLGGPQATRHVQIPQLTVLAARRRFGSATLLTV